MTVSKAFKVREGRKISKQELAKVGQPQSETGVKVILPFCDPVNATGLLKKASTRPPGDQTKQTVVSPTNEEGLPWFTCPKQDVSRRSEQIKPFGDTWTLAAMRLNSTKSHNMTRSDTNGPSIA